MAVKPNPYKLVCQKCGNKMERRSVDKFSLTNLFNIFKNYTRG